MKVIKNIMIVSVFIMLQMQSAHSSGKELDCVDSDAWSLFASRHHQLCDADAQLIDSLKCVERQSSLFLGVGVEQQIAALKKSHLEVEKLLDCRADMCAYVSQTLTSFNVLHSKKVAFHALNKDSKHSGRADNDQEKAMLQDRVKSVRDDCQKVLGCIYTHKCLAEEHKKSIVKMLKNDSCVDESSGATSYSAKFFSNLRALHDSIEESEELLKTCRARFIAFLEKEEGFDSELRLIQKGLKEKEQRRISFAVYGSLGLCVAGVLLSLYSCVCT
ncbi:MAG: hypothetical protein OXC30_03075 [Alphaproteobacteria bacterium]|nr:hypothetical protein [Alphaproteobacteria bacterium]